MVERGALDTYLAGCRERAAHKAGASAPPPL
jgi:hypothetical protein